MSEPKGRGEEGERERGEKEKGNKGKNIAFALYFFFTCLVTQPCVPDSSRPHQAPLSMEFSRQEYWSGLPFPTPFSFTDFSIFFV